MTIQHEADYQAVMDRLHYLLDHEPANVAEITRLGNLADAYENEQGHRPLAADSSIAQLEREIRRRQMTLAQTAELLQTTVGHLQAVLGEQISIDIDLAQRLQQRLGLTLSITKPPHASLHLQPDNSGPERVRGAADHSRQAPDSADDTGFSERRRYA